MKDHLKMPLPVLIPSFASCLMRMALSAIVPVIMKFNGNSDSTFGDEDWIAIDLKAGTEYTFSVGGMKDGMLNDSILKLLDHKGNVVKMNDDVDGPGGDLSSEIKFTPDAAARYYLSVSAYNSANVTNSGEYTLEVMEKPYKAPDIDGGDSDDKLFGTDEAETINGNTGDDVLSGGGGDDTLNGGDDDDLLEGGPGADTLNGGKGEDTASYEGSAEGVTINLLAGIARGGDAAGDEIGTDIENLTGSMHADDLTGDDDPNSIWGLGGDDELDGGEGDDTLEGGPGADMLTGGEVLRWRHCVLGGFRYGRNGAPAQPDAHGWRC